MERHRELSPVLPSLPPFLLFSLLFDNSVCHWFSCLEKIFLQDFYLINNTDTLYPKITSIPYPKVGEENSAARIGISTITEPKTVWVMLPGVPKDMYVPRMSWADNAEQVLIQQMNRKQDTNTLFYADAKTGEAKPFFIEQEDTFIELVEDPKWLKDSQSFLWQSERDGWKHVFKVSRDGNTVINFGVPIVSELHSKFKIVQA